MRPKIVVLCIYCFLLLTSQILATDLCGSVSGTLTAAGNPYIVTCDIFVTSGNTLMIEEGVEMRFNAGLKLTVDGTLDVNGSGASPVIFTSNKPVPAMRDWKGIRVNNSSSIENAIFRYGDYALHYFHVPTFEITACIFEFNDYGLFYQGAYYDYSGSGAITGCSFSDNFDGLAIYSADPTVIVNNCTFDRNYCPVDLLDSYPTFTGLIINPDQTAYNGIMLGPFEHEGTLYNTGYPYCGSIYTTGYNTTITIEKGVVMKLGELSIYEGHLIANGTASEPVIFTSWSDDSVGGDTNCDGPSIGSSWYADMGGGSATITHAIFRYADLGFFLISGTT
jgi:hypothetical protein